MPYATRPMISYMKTKGIRSAVCGNNDGGQQSRTTSCQNNIRELPSSVAPFSGAASRGNCKPSRHSSRKSVMVASGSPISRKSGSGQNIPSNSRKSSATPLGAASITPSHKLSRSGSKVASKSSGTAISGGQSGKISGCGSMAPSNLRESSGVPIGAASRAPSRKSGGSGSKSASQSCGTAISAPQSRKISEHNSMTRSNSRKSSGTHISNSLANVSRKSSGVSINRHSGSKGSIKTASSRHSGGSRSHSANNSQTSSNHSSTHSQSVNYNTALPASMSTSKMTFDDKLVLYMQTMIKANVKRLKSHAAYLRVDEYQDQFREFCVNESRQVAAPHSCKAIYETKHCRYSEKLVCKLYDKGNESKLFFQIIRHLGKKNPHIVPSWEVYVQDNTIFMFQEFASFGNLTDFIAKKGALHPDKVQWAALQLRRAIDFLGDMGVCHRAIAPDHILMTNQNEPLIKLGGFRSAIIYYDDRQEDINYQPCLPLSCRGKFDFHAPEIFGEPNEEVFDPVVADVWSFGACLFNMLTGNYPYDVTQENAQIEEEIQANVRALKVPKGCHSVLSGCLTTRSTERISIEKLGEHFWLNASNK